MKRKKPVKAGGNSKQGGFSTEVKYPENEDKLKIALLEGQLAATEARLLEYIKADEMKRIYR